MEKGRWFGSDASNAESLFSNGFLMRRCGVIYEVVVWIGSGYVYGLFDDKSLVSDLDDNLGKENDPFPSWKSLADMSGSTVEDYRHGLLDDCNRDTRAQNLLSDMISFYGVEDAVSIDWSAKTYTENQIRQRLNKAIAQPITHCKGNGELNQLPII